MNALSITDFLVEHPDLKPFVIHTEGNNSKWGRVICQWHEKKTDHKHLFIPLINLETGEMYLDCSKKKIYAKFIAHTLIRPLHIFLKTIYHAAFVISIPLAIIETIFQGKKDHPEYQEIFYSCLRNSCRSLADIVRTPLYGIAMMVVSIAALLITPFYPYTIYSMREWIGQLIQSLEWHEIDHYDRDPFPCFAPIDSLSEAHFFNKKYDNTYYKTGASAYEIGLNNLARAYVEFRRTHYHPCNDPLRLLDPEVQYISPCYGDVLKAQP